MSNCSVEGCESPVKYKGLCGKHYKRAWRHGNPTTTLINMERKPEKCKVDGCEKMARYPVLQMCHVHYIRWDRYKRTERVKAESGKGRPKTTAGYVLLTVNGERIYEHIHLAEKALGKKLPAGAIVHHMNGCRADNFTPFNLVVCPNQDYHLLLHRRAKMLEKRDE